MELVTGLPLGTLEQVYDMLLWATVFLLCIPRNCLPECFTAFCLDFMLLTSLDRIWHYASMPLLVVLFLPRNVPYLYCVLAFAKIKKHHCVFVMLSKCAVNTLTETPLSLCLCCVAVCSKCYPAQHQASTTRRRLNAQLIWEEPQDY